MNRSAPLFANLRQAFLAWTVLLSLVLVWSGAQPRSSEVPTQAIAASLSAVQAAEHVATLSAGGKLHRAPEFRAGGDADAVVLAAGLVLAAPGSGRDLAVCTEDAPCGASHRALPEPRAPPRI